MNRVARIISFIFHPLVFLVALPYLVVYKKTASPLYAFKWLLFSSVFIFLGIVVFFWARWRKIFSDQDVSRKEERYDFYLLICVFAVIYFVVAVGFKGIFFPLSIVSFGIILAIVLFATVNFFLKVSLHTGVAAAFVCAIALLHGQAIFWSIFWIVPLVAWSRVFLKKHSRVEVTLGAILGIIVTLLTFVAGRHFYYR